MGYRNLQSCLADLEATRQLVRVDAPIDPHLEMAEIQRRVYQAQGPALLFTNVVGCRFPMVGNLFGTLDRTRFLFRDALAAVRLLVELKIDPAVAAKHPWRFRHLPWALAHMRVKPVRRGPILDAETTVSQLPQLVCWPRDGGPFVTLPQVYSEDAAAPGFAKSNLGMYRVQLGGNQYAPDREIGLHYQIHRGIGAHHAAALQAGVPFRVNIFVGGPPAMTLAAVMPLPEGLSELMFAGALGGRRVAMVTRPGELPYPAEADFVIQGTVIPDRLLPEGPFGDHLGYYSLQHDFPVLRVERVRHRRDAVWPFTVVGRPPQEDTSFGAIIHELTGPAIPSVIAGVKAVHAVDAAGVHPLLLAIGSERYVPYAAERQPQELLTCANAILGQGQLSLAKYLCIVAAEDAPGLDIHDIPAFLQHLLARINFERDLHFQTCTTIDTLDYSGTGLNAGSKLVLAAAGPVRRQLAGELRATAALPEGFHDARLVLPGIAAIAGPAWSATGPASIEKFAEQLPPGGPFAGIPLLVVVDDSRFAAESVHNFLWVTFTRSNPAADVTGGGAFTRQKHWGCTGPLIIDARIKPHHAPPLVEDPAITRRVDALAAPGGQLHGLL